MIANKDLIKGTTTTLILKVIAAQDCYGYDIIKQVKDLSSEAFLLKEGTLYPILHSLERDKLIESYWKDGDGQRKRKYYRVTKKGRTALVERQKEWKAFTTAVDQVLAPAKFSSLLSLKSGG